jgi:hypothetical protein
VAFLSYETSCKSPKIFEEEKFRSSGVQELKKEFFDDLNIV